MRSLIWFDASARAFWLIWDNPASISSLADALEAYGREVCGSRIFCCFRPRQLTDAATFRPREPPRSGLLMQVGPPALSSSGAARGEDAEVNELEHRSNRGVA